MYPALRSLPSCAPINRDHAREHERKSDFCFEVGNETRNPRRRGHVPIQCCGVACAQVAKKPNHKPNYVNSPADTFRFCHSTEPRSSAAAATSIGLTAHVSITVFWTKPAAHRLSMYPVQLVILAVLALLLGTLLLSL